MEGELCLNYKDFLTKNKKIKHANNKVTQNYRK